MITLLLAATCSIPDSTERPGRSSGTIEQPTPDATSNHMRITIGTSTFAATLYDNDTAAAFKAMLPMTLTMTELNGNEKYFRLSDNLPTDASNPGTIQSGDLMLYRSNTIVLFYETFSTSYSYTRIGRIDDPTGLAAAVGSENVAVTFQLDEITSRDTK